MTSTTGVQIYSAIHEKLSAIQVRLIEALMRNDVSELKKMESSLFGEEKKVSESENSQKESPSKSRIRQTYEYSYRKTNDTIIETINGKNTFHSHISREEFLTIAAVLAELIDSKGYFQSDEEHYRRSGFSIPRIRNVFRICERLGVMNKTYKSGRIYSAKGAQSGFVAEAEKAWIEGAHKI